MLKSAYEIAMENSGGASKKSLTEEQKKALAEIDNKYDAQIAEKEILFHQRMRDEGAGGDEIARELAKEKQDINERRERDKKKIREA